MTRYKLHETLVKMFPTHYIGLGSRDDIIIRDDKHLTYIHKICLDTNSKGDILKVMNIYEYPSRPNYIPNLHTTIENILKLEQL